MSFDLDQLGEYLTKLLNSSPKGASDSSSDSPDSGDDAAPYDSPDSDSSDMAVQSSAAGKAGGSPATAQGAAARLNRAKYYTQKPDDDVMGNKVYQRMYGGKFHCTSDCGRFLYNVAKAEDPKLPDVIIKDIRSHVIQSKDWTTGATADGGMRPGDLLFRKEKHGAIYGGIEKGANGKPEYVTYEASLDDHNPIRKTWGSVESIQNYYGRYARPKREK